MKGLRRRPSGSEGFTLVEMMVVIAIIGLIAVLVIPQITHRMDEARIKTTRLQIRELESAVDMFKIDNGFYPSHLEDLIRRPANAKTWPPYGYLKELPRDGWENGFVYIYPAVRGPYEIISYGADGRQGGVDENADISNYSTTER